MGPVSQEELDQNSIGELRDEITKGIQACKIITGNRPEYGAEVTLAQRHLEDARMRLGCALAMLRGEDPFAYKQPGE